MLVSLVETRLKKENQRKLLLIWVSEMFKVASFFIIVGFELLRFYCTTR